MTAADLTFADLKLHPTIQQAVATEGYVRPTPIQRQAIPHVLAGTDLVALAQTGTGKTAAFVLPILHRMHASTEQRRGIRVLVLAPTRELAGQIGASVETYGRGLPYRHTVIFGGVGKEPQVRALTRGVDIVVATPGRLLDLLGERRLDLSTIDTFVLDEADRMLDMGFLPDVKRVIAALPNKRQTLLFSATMPNDIADLAARILKNPARVEVTPPSTTVESIAQSVFMVEQARKRELLHHLLTQPEVKRVLVFTRTKHSANRVAEYLEKRGIDSAAIHGNKSQNARQRALDGFTSGAMRVLVATDIAARGIDIDGITHVIQVDLPEVPEQYVHRIGRTARAGASGVAWAFCASDERQLLRDIERNIRRPVPVSPHAFEGPAPAGASQQAFNERGPRPPRPDSRRGPPRRGHRSSRSR